MQVSGQRTSADRFVIGEFEVLPSLHELRRSDGTVIDLPARSFQILLHLILHRERVVPRSELLFKFWDGMAEAHPYDEALTQCLSSVRNALDDCGDVALYIDTLNGEGYRFIGPCETQSTHGRRALRRS